jgi:hypothetical protein
VTHDTGLSGWDGGDDQALLALLDVHFSGDVTKYGVTLRRETRLYKVFTFNSNVRLK